MYISDDDNSFHKKDLGNGVSISLTEDKFLSIYISIETGTVVKNLMFKPQLELNSTKTPYEMYQGKSYTPSANGVVDGINSISPASVLLTNTKGVLIDCEYNRDLNKVIEKLEQNLL